MNTLTALKAAESKLISTLDAATLAVDAVGTDALQAAVSRFEEAALHAQARLDNAMRIFSEAVGGAAALAGRLAGELLADLDACANDQPTPPHAPALPAPKAATIDVPAATPTRQEGTQAVEENGATVAPLSTPEFPQSRRHDSDVIELADYDDEVPYTVAACSPAGRDDRAIPGVNGKAKAKTKRKRGEQ